MIFSVSSFWAARERQAEYLVSSFSLTGHYQTGGQPMNVFRSQNAFDG
jgi:hypothetical protein